MAFSTFGRKNKDVYDIFSLCLFSSFLFVQFLWFLYFLWFVFFFFMGILGMIYYLRMRIVVYECGNSIISDYNVSDLSIAKRDGCHVWYRNGQPFRGT